MEKLADGYLFKSDHFGEHFRAMFEEGVFLDGDIATKSQPGLVLKVHRVVVAAVSPYLKRLFSTARPDQTVFVGNVEYNSLVAVLDLIYKGQVKVKETEKEDFLTTLRSLAVKFGTSMDDVTYEKSMSCGPSNPASTRSRMNRGVVSYRPPIKSEPCEPAPQPILDLTQQGNSTEPAGPNIPSTPTRTSGKAAHKGAVTVTMGPPEQKCRIILSHPEPSSSKKTWHEPLEYAPLSKRAKLPRRSPGPHGLFWLRIVNQVDTTRHAVRDKYDKFGLQTVEGSFDRNGELYLGFLSQDGSETAIEIIRRAEPETDITPANRLPDSIFAVVPGSQTSSLQQGGLPNQHEGVVGKLYLREFPPHFGKTDYAQLLTRCQFRHFLLSSIHAEGGGSCAVEFKNKSELEKAKRHFHQREIEGRKVRAFTISEL